MIGVVRDAHLATLDEVEPMIFSPSPEREGAPGGLDRTNTTANFLVRHLAVSDLARQAPGLMARLDGRAHVEVRAGSTAVDTATQGALVWARVVGGLAMMAIGSAVGGLAAVAVFSAYKMWNPRAAAEDGAHAASVQPTTKQYAFALPSMFLVGAVSGILGLGGGVMLIAL